MSEQFTEQDFRDAAGVDQWRILPSGAHALYRPASFAEGARFAAAVAEAADAAEHHPDIELRYGAVSIRLLSHDVHTLTERDLDLARSVSHLAREFGLEADPSSIGDS